MNRCAFDGSQQPKIPPRLRRIRRLNDALRMNGVGGSVVVTDGIAGLGYDEARTIVAAVAAFDRFDANNNPYGERDFGSLEAAGETVIFKIDYYDRSLRLHSPDPADAKLTARVLTIMLASEY